MPTNAELRKLRAARKRASLEGKTTEQRIHKIRVNSPITEFEIHAFLYMSLKSLGIEVRGEIGTCCRTARFDLVVVQDGVASRLIEVKKPRKKGQATGAGQARDYTRFGLPVDLVIGMEQAQKYIDHVSQTHQLPPPTYSHEKPMWQVRQEAEELDRLAKLQTVLPEDTVTITHDMFVAAARKTGRHSARQLRVLGVQWPLKKGWTRSIVGKTFLRKDYEEFVAIGKQD
jgi:hypothetical protein